MDFVQSIGLMGLLFQVLGIRGNEQSRLVQKINLINVKILSACAGGIETEEARAGEGSHAGGQTGRRPRSRTVWIHFLATPAFFPQA